MSKLSWLVMSFLSAALAACATSSTPPATEFQDLVRNHTLARGGAAAIEAIRAIEARVKIAEPTYTAEGTWRVDRSGRMRIDVEVDGKRVFSEGFDGLAGWEMGGDAVHGTPAVAGASALRHSTQLPTNILGLHEMAARGHRLRLEGDEMLGAVRYIVIVLTLDDGFETRYYLDPVSFLVARARTRKPLHPDVDPAPTTIETVWSDYREVSGVLMAFHATDTDLATGKWLQTTTLLDVRANPPLDEAMFRMP